MRRVAVILAVQAAALAGLALPAWGQPDPPRGPCNRGTEHAHETVPHHAPGNMVAHQNIPHC